MGTLLIQGMAWLLMAGTLLAADLPQNNSDLSLVRKNLSRYSRVEGHFDQVREMKDPPLKLESSGNFQFQQPLKLIWQQSQPFSLDLQISKDKMIQKTSGGSEQTITKAEQPVIFIFSSSFLDVFSGDEKSIRENFTYEVFFQGKKWTLALFPKDELLKKVIAKVKIHGAEFIEEVSIVERSGSSTVISFSKIKGSH